MLLEYLSEDYSGEICFYLYLFTNTKRVLQNASVQIHFLWNLLFIFFLKEVAYDADIVLERIFPQHMMIKMMSNHFTISRNCPEWNCASTTLCNEIEYFPIIWSAPTIDDQQWQLRRDNKLLRLLTMSVLFCSCSFWTLLQMCN